MNDKIFKSATFLLIVLIGSAAWAGKAKAVTFDEVTSDPAIEKWVRVQKTGKPSKKGEGTVPNLARLDAPPKRVALISFYVQDPGSATGSYYSARREFNWLTQDGASHFAQSFYDQGIETLKQTFAGHGMTVLTSEEFLDTEAKKQAYLAYELQMSSAAKIALGFIKGMERAAKGNVKTSAVAAGYRLLPTHQVPTDPKTAVSLNELRRQLEVDALLIVKNGTISSAKSMALADIHIMLFGPNPMHKEEGKRYIQWKDGQHYADVVLALRKVPQVAYFGNTKKGEPAIKNESYEGYEKLLALAAEATAADLMQKINGD